VPVYWVSASRNCLGQVSPPYFYVAVGRLLQAQIRFVKIRATPCLDAVLDKVEQRPVGALGVMSLHPILSSFVPMVVLLLRA